MKIIGQEPFGPHFCLARLSWFKKGATTIGKPGPKRVLKNVVIQGVYLQIKEFLGELTHAKLGGCSNPNCKGWRAETKASSIARQNRRISQRERERVQEQGEEGVSIFEVVPFIFATPKHEGEKN